MYLTDLFALLDMLCTQPQAYEQPKTKFASPLKTCSCRQPKTFANYTCPAVQRTTFNGDTTIVFFVDGTYSIVTRSPEDKYDRKTAVLYAIAKRMFGTLGKTDKNGKFHPNEVDSKGFTAFLQKTVDAGFDQKLEEETASEKKQAAHAAHLARQEAQKKAAFDKRVEARAKEILLERAATDRANQIENEARDIQPSRSCTKNNDNKTMNTKYDTKSYIKPNKPFKKFTDEEKREYWRYHNAKRKNK